MEIKLANPSDIPKSWYGSIVGFDLETTDLSIDSEICMASIYNPTDDISLVIPIKTHRSGVPSEINSSELAILKEFLSTVRVAGYNLQFDLSMVAYHWGVYVKPYFDAFILIRMLQFKEQSLKKVILNLFPRMVNLISEFNDVMGQKPPFSYDIDNEKVVRYSGFDAVLPFLAIKGLAKEIEHHKPILRLEMLFLEEAIKMRVSGLRVDLHKYDLIMEELKTSFNEGEKELADWACNPAFRVHASADLRDLLFRIGGIAPTLMTPKGDYSVNGQALSQMLDNEKNNPVRVELIEKIIKVKHQKSVLSSSL